MPDKRKSISNWVTKIWQHNHNGYCPEESQNLPNDQNIQEPSSSVNEDSNPGLEPSSFAEDSSDNHMDTGGKNNEDESDNDIVNDDVKEDLTEPGSSSGGRENDFITHNQLFAAIDTPDFYKIASRHYGIDRFQLSRKQKEECLEIMTCLVKCNETAFANSEDSEFTLPNFAIMEPSQEVLDFIERDRYRRNLHKSYSSSTSSS